MRPSSKQVIQSPRKPAARRTRLLIAGTFIGAIALAGCQTNATGATATGGDVSKNPKRFGSEFSGTPIWTIGNQR